MNTIRSSLYPFIENRNIRRLLAIGLIFMLQSVAAVSAQGETAMTLALTSPAFADHAEIPGVYTCKGSDISPALTWSGVPGHAQSLVLIVDDPDAPNPLLPVMTWVHWLLYNIPPSATGLSENIAPGALPAGTLQGKNDWKQTGYRGPCPPIGKHRYFFKLYALDIVLPDLKTPNKAQLERAMAKHVIAHAEWVGVYQKP